MCLMAGLVALAGCAPTPMEPTPPVDPSPSSSVTSSETSPQESASPPVNSPSATTPSAQATTEPPRVFDDVASIWAGYVVEDGAPFTSVEGRFVVPHLTCGPGDTDKAFTAWVGFDGFGTDAVEQAGVTGQCDGVSGAGHPAIDGVMYEAWFMMYNAGETDVFDLLIRPGDVIFNRVRLVGDKYELLVRNETLGEERSSLQPCEQSDDVEGECDRAHVEWIVERPGATALLDFDPVRLYDNRATTADGRVVTPAQVNAIRVDMVQNDALLAETGALAPDGSFEVNFVESGVIGE